MHGVGVGEVNGSRGGNGVERERDDDRSNVVDRDHVHVPVEVGRRLELNTTLNEAAHEVVCGSKSCVCVAHDATETVDAALKTPRSHGQNQPLCHPFGLGVASMETSRLGQVHALLHPPTEATENGQRRDVMHGASLALRRRELKYLDSALDIRRSQRRVRVEAVDIGSVVNYQLHPGAEVVVDTCREAQPSLCDVSRNDLNAGLVTGVDGPSVVLAR
mmetsp:Transcript_42724/g.100513  ORF Transcript_42724/g.100513 Transcript_42724/m.100513 type:complete len:218 (-) Transcript_42724:576-1229(-)